MIKILPRTGGHESREFTQCPVKWNRGDSYHDTSCNFKILKIKRIFYKLPRKCSVIPNRLGIKILKRNKKSKKAIKHSAPNSEGKGLRGDDVLVPALLYMS